ncbi:MAG TPA: DUF2164 domain-containing protein [Holophagaceae bacterium]
MDIRLSPDTSQRLHASIRRFVAEEYGVSLGDLGAGVFLDFCLKEVAPAVYNQAIADAQAHLQDRVADLENVCFAEDGGYWKADGKRAVARKPASRR